MKKIILGAVLAVAAASSITANAASTVICASLTSAAGGASVAAGTGFVKTDFTTKCSVNVILLGDDQSAVLFKVGSTSVKGKTFFGGSSAGGAVGNMGTCSGTCAQANAQSGLTAAPDS